jgi:hypothetical protein
MIKPLFPTTLTKKQTKKTGFIQEFASRNQFVGYAIRNKNFIHQFSCEL